MKRVLFGMVICTQATFLLVMRQHRRSTIPCTRAHPSLSPTSAMVRLAPPCLPQDDHEGLAHILNKITHKIDYSQTTSTDKQILQALQRDFWEALARCRA